MKAPRVFLSVYSFDPKRSISSLMSSERRKPSLNARESKEAQEQARSRTKRAHSETPGGKQAKRRNQNAEDQVAKRRSELPQEKDETRQLDAEAHATKRRSELPLEKDSGKLKPTQPSDARSCLWRKTTGS